ncbi:MAG: DKNYY domain-containing protein [Vicinamibacterales bacterium]
MTMKGLGDFYGLTPALTRPARAGTPPIRSRRWTLPRRSLPFAIDVLLCMLVGACSHGYTKSNDQVQYTGQSGDSTVTSVVHGADVASFEGLNDEYGKDKNRAYYDDKPIVGALPASFVALSTRYAKDTDRVYCYGKAIAGALPASFATLQTDWAKDSDHVYYDCDRVDGADPASFVVSSHDGIGEDKSDIFDHSIAFKVCDRKSFHWLSGEWAVDDKCAYNGPFKLPGAHPKTFVVLDDSFAKDDEHVYSYLRPYVVAGADAATFEVDKTCSSCGRDKNHCYNDNSEAACRSAR